MTHHNAWRRAVIPLVVTVSLLVWLPACGSSRKSQKARSIEPSRQEAPQAADGGATPIAPTASPYELSDIHFDFDRADLRLGDRQILTRHGQWLSENSAVRVLIEGHCDERGTTEYNLALGERRAEAARDFLTSYGIDMHRLDVISYGEERPLTPGHDEQAWTLNRRAHFVRR